MTQCGSSLRIGPLPITRRGYARLFPSIEQLVSRRMPRRLNQESDIADNHYIYGVFRYYRNNPWSPRVFWEKNSSRFSIDIYRRLFLADSFHRGCFTGNCRLSSFKSVAQYRSRLDYRDFRLAPVTVSDILLDISMTKWKKKHPGLWKLGISFLMVGTITTLVFCCLIK